jgi:protein-disulfide isomerase
MKTFQMVLIGAIFTVLCFGTANATEETKVQLDEESVKSIVEKVIRENPKLIFDAYNNYRRELARKRQKRQLEANFNNPINYEIDPGNPKKGPEDAPITIIENTDFECPYCARGARTVKQLMEKYPGKIRLVFKNKPLSMHKNAESAAKAALAAHEQGKFWEYHDLLFSHSRQLGEEKYKEFAEQLGLDMEKFNKDRHSTEIAEQIEFDSALADEFGLRGTPSFVINGVIVKGAKPLSYFEKVINRLLAQSEKSE